MDMALTYAPPGARMRLIFLVVALTPAAILAANRTMVWLPQAIGVLLLLCLCRPRIGGAAVWLWLGVIAWAVVQAGSFAIHPDESWRGVVRLGLYGGVFAIAHELARSPGGARSVFGAAALWCAALCGYGLMAEAAGINPALSFLGAPDAYPGAVKATFINRNAFALYAGVGMLAAAARFVSTGAFDPHGFIARATGRGAIWATCFMICAVALIMTGSRGGVFATAIGFAGFAALTGVRMRWVIPATIGAFALVLLMEGANRWSLLSEERFEIHHRLIAAIIDAPWTGVGLGGFQDGFRPIAAADWRWGDWDHAHNAWLEAAFELGLPGAAMQFTSLALLSAAALNTALRNRRRAPYGAAALAALIAAGAQGLVDISLAIPAVPTLLAMLLGAGVARPPRRSRTETDEGSEASVAR